MILHSRLLLLCADNWKKDTCQYEQLLLSTRKEELESSFQCCFRVWESYFFSLFLLYGRSDIVLAV